jgi:hypothetical protein
VITNRCRNASPSADSKKAISPGAAGNKSTLPGKIWANHESSEGEILLTRPCRMDNSTDYAYRVLTLSARGFTSHLYKMIVDQLT